MHEMLSVQTGNSILRNNGQRNNYSPKNKQISKLSIIIPCYNEAATIDIVLDKIANTCLIYEIDKEIIIINDCSTDPTDSIIRQYIVDNPNVSINYIRHSLNQGKGAAIHSGINIATGDYILIQDADLEYDPSEYNLLLDPIIKGYADVVYGSRFIGGHPHRVLFFWHTLGNKLLTFISNLLTNMNLTDAHTCYKLISLSTIKNLSLQEKRFAFDAELNVKVSQLRLIRIYEVGISYYGRTFAEGKKIRLKDALRTVYCLVKYSLFHRAHKYSNISKSRSAISE
jgi:glycosyltransferase involved in cell wall biosynthesis